MAMSPFDSFLSMPFDTKIELPNELWTEQEQWLPNIDDFSMENSDQFDSFLLEKEPSTSVPFGHQVEQESCQSTPGSVGYLSMPHSFTSSPASFGMNELMDAAQGMLSLSAQEIVQTVPATELMFNLSQKKMPEITGDSKLKRSLKHATAAPSAESRSVDPSKYKTRLCRNWKETGKCPYGETCVYAHGMKEMRCKESNEAAVLSLTKLADHLSRQRGNNRLSAPRHTADSSVQPTALPSTNVGMSPYVATTASIPLPMNPSPYMLRNITPHSFIPDCPALAGQSPFIPVPRKA